MKKYDIFISYRRESFNQANLIYTRLKALGYRVFLDVEALNSGKFNEQLLNVIKESTDVISVLPPKALDRCINQDDWVRRELTCALENKKNIIPVMLAGFQWPDPMPEGLEELCQYQAIAPIPDVYFDMQIKKLQSFLKSRAHFRQQKRWFIGIGIVTAIVAILALLAFSIFQTNAKKLSDNLFLRTQEMVSLDQINTDAQEYWVQFVDDLKNAKTIEDQADITRSFQKSIDKLQKEVGSLLNTMKANHIETSGIHSFLYKKHGIDPMDINQVDMFTQSCVDDLLNQFNLYEEIIESGLYNKLSMQTVEMGCIINRAFIEIYYYSYLQILTHMPKNCQERFYQFSHQWTSMPNTGLNLPDKEYERLCMASSEKAEQAIAKQNKLFRVYDAELDEIQQQLDELEKQAILIDSLYQTTPK